MTDSTENARDKLVDEFAAVLAEAEEMLKRAATETGDKARDLRSQVETKLLRAKLSLQSSRARPSIKRRPPRARLTTMSTTIRGRRSASRPQSASPSAF
jgi:ElaB/YqjD/DUF883 family membrane-anchored ribosome-binding protein